jgi:hypothetical protein
MLLTISEFRARVSTALPTLVNELQQLTGRQNPNESAAWKSSLPKVSRAFSEPMFQPLHLYFGDRGNLSLEYRLPASSSWCDMVLLGAHEKNAAAVIVELKDWQTRMDKPGPYEGLMLRHTGPTLHPSDQVQGYAEYCRRFHSAILESGALIHGCVLFTNDAHFPAYKEEPNQRLAKSFPCFAATNSQIDITLAAFFKERLTQPDPNFAKNFELGVYRQDRNFVRQMAEQVKAPNGGPFELLDNQRLGFALCKAEIEKAIFSTPGTPQKTVIIIDGPPGSGKSVLAGKLWAWLATDPRTGEGNFVVTTTSKAQETNWQHIFGAVARDRAGSGVVMAANKYAPDTIHGLSQWMQRFPGKFDDPLLWRDHCKLIKGLRGGFWMPDQHMLVSVVDEAHALINPEHSDARGQSGWPVNLGPQAFHIIRASVVSIFLLDTQQSFRERETTTVSDITTWAHELGADVSPIISLAGGQFRCAGSREYVDWVEGLCAGRPASNCADLAKPWSSANEIQTGEVAFAAERYGSDSSSLFTSRRPKGPDFQIFDTPFELEAALRERVKAGATARLVAPFARKWKTKPPANPHELPPDMWDFQIEVKQGHQKQIWSRPWNVVPGGDDYTHFIQGPPGSRIHDDPLAEVGCTYAVRGFDFDYIGLLWLDDLKWRSGKWEVFPKEVHETGLIRFVQRAKKEDDSSRPHHQALLKKVLQSYRILLTRALKGVYMWCEDKETKQHLESALGLKA